MRYLATVGCPILCHMEEIIYLGRKQTEKQKQDPESRNCSVSIALEFQLNL